jgi:hypothetical protein
MISLNILSQKRCIYNTVFQRPIELTHHLYTHMLPSQMQVYFFIYSSSLLHVSAVPGHHQATVYLAYDR